MKKPKNKTNLFLKTLMSFFGVTILSIGATFLRGGNVGLDPFTALNTGISDKLGLGLGVYQLSVNLILFLFVLFFDRKKIGIGTFLNMILVGFEIQWFTVIYHDTFGYLFGDTQSILIVIADTVIGLALFTLGTSLYMSPRLGAAPYDAIAPIISNKLKAPYRWVRVTQDILFMIGAFLAGGPVGFATIIVAFFTGPLITWWNQHVSNSLVDSIDEITGPQRQRNVLTGILVHLSSRTVKTIRNTFDATEEIKKNSGDYSTSDLKKQLKIIHRNIINSKRVYDSFVEQYNMIEEELEKRSKTIDLKKNDESVE